MYQKFPSARACSMGFALTVTPAHQRAHLLDCSETTHNQSVYTYTCRELKLNKNMQVAIKAIVILRRIPKILHKLIQP
jgi:hypothetical protein